MNELPEFKLTKKHVNYGILICLIFLIVTIFMLYRVIKIADSNPCLACSSMTEYVCINKTDLPPLWRPDSTWKEVHNADRDLTSAEE